jgi:hypothetical protein
VSLAKTNQLNSSTRKASTKVRSKLLIVRPGEDDLDHTPTAKTG